MEVISKNKYAQKIDELCFEVKDFIGKPMVRQPIKNYDNDLMYIHITLNKVTQQLGLFDINGGVKYYNLITLLILEAYQLIKLITPQIEQTIKNQLLTKALQVFNTYSNLLDNKNARKEYKI